MGFKKNFIANIILNFTQTRSSISLIGDMGKGDMIFIENDYPSREKFPKMKALAQLFFSFGDDNILKGKLWTSK